MKIAIVGGGIAGLYAAYKLQENPRIKTIVIFEKHARLGGRIKTVDFPGGGHVEAGAGRLSSKHKRALALVKELNLKLIKFPKAKAPPVYLERGVEKEKIPLLEPAPDNVTFQEWIHQHYNKAAAHTLANQYGYDSLLKTNARDASREIQHLGHGTFYTLEGGLSSLVSALSARLSPHKVQVHKGHAVKSIPALLDRFDHVVLATTAPDLWKLKVDTGSIVPHPLTRIYAYFSDTTFSGNRRMTCDNAVRQCIPISKNVLMASYSTDAHAESWGRMPTHRLPGALHAALKQAYGPWGDAVPWPQSVRRFYWKTGTHSWGVGSKTFTHPFDPRRLHICGEVASKKNHAWIEGALESVEALVCPRNS